MVNSVSFAATRGIYDRANLDAPQANQRQTATTQPEVAPKKKKHTAAKVIAGTVAAVAVAAAALALGSKFGVFNPTKVGNVLGGLKNASWLQWAKEPAKKTLSALDAAGNFVKGYAKQGLELAKGGYDYVADKAVKGFEAVKGFFTRKPAAPTA